MNQKNNEDPISKLGDLLVIRHSDNVRIISFRSRDYFSNNNDQEIMASFSEIIENISFPCAIIFNFSHIEELNEEELGSFTSVALAFQHSDNDIVLCNLSVQVQQLIEDLELEGLFQLAAEEQDALYCLTLSDPTLNDFNPRF